VTNTVNLFCNGAVGFIDRLGMSLGDKGELALRLATDAMGRIRWIPICQGLLKAGSW
jgi:hypothetical protein